MLKKSAINSVREFVQYRWNRKNISTYTRSEKKLLVLPYICYCAIAKCKYNLSRGRENHCRDRVFRSLEIPAALISRGLSFSLQTMSQLRVVLHLQYEEIVDSGWITHQRTDQDEVIQRHGNDYLRSGRPWSPRRLPVGHCFAFGCPYSTTYNL